jgi:hypothetical protein
MLGEPPWPTYAIGPAQWKAALSANMEQLPEHVPGACEYEVWHYSPALVAGSDLVDPLSLTISLQNNPDERVEQALDVLKEHIPW